MESLPDDKTESDGSESTEGSEQLNDQMKTPRGGRGRGRGPRRPRKGKNGELNMIVEFSIVYPKTLFKAR